MLQLTVIELKPEGADAVSVVDTDCEVDFDVPSETSPEAGSVHLGGTELEVTALAIGAEPIARYANTNTICAL